MVIQTWAFGRYFIRNEQGEPVNSWKTMVVFSANYKFRVLKCKLEFGKTCSCYLDITASQKTFLSDVKLFHNEVCEH